MTNLQLTALNSRFYAPCTAHGEKIRNLHAMIDTGSNVTAVRSDICQDLSLLHAGTLPVGCVHGAHADMMVQRYFCTITLGKKDRRIIVYELEKLVEGGNAIDAILGLNMLEGCRMTLDWERMEGTLEV